MTPKREEIPSILSEEQYRSCELCPRRCGADRTAGGLGYCRCSDRILAARAALHLWEEPCISGRPAPADAANGASRGSGAVFFSGCTLGCSFCQNYPISHERFGREISIRQLADIFLRLQEQGAYNINLVTATQYLPSVIRALDLVREQLTVPVVYNCGGYERPEIVRALAGYVDIWLPDLKYFDPSLAVRCSQAGDYFTYASRAIRQMIAQTGPPVTDENGLLRSGVIVRHMVLPGARLDSIRLLHWMKENLPEKAWLLSLMSQYTPAGENIPSSGQHGFLSQNIRPSRKQKSSSEAVRPPSPRPEHKSTSAAELSCREKSSVTAGSCCRYPDLSRRVTTYEYESVVNAAVDLGLTNGYMQQKSSAREEYTPPFDLEGIEPAAGSPRGEPNRS